MRIRLLAALALVAWTGCTTSVTTTIRHPLQTGALDANRIPLTYRGTERQRGLPAGVLNDEAEITQLSTERICFDVSLNAITDEAGQTWTDLQNFEVGLDAGSDLHIVHPEIAPHAATAHPYHGLNPVERQTGTRRECTDRNDDGQCEEWVERPIVETVYEPGIVTVVSGGGQICFSNQGFVTPATEQVKLVLRRPARRLEFEWVFSSIVSSGARPSR